MTWKTNYDGQGNIIKPGDVCIRNTRNGKCEYLIYVDSVWGGQTSKGDFGRFLSKDGFTSIKYINVLFAFDPMSKRRATKGVQELIRKFYEQGNKKDMHIQA